MSVQFGRWNFDGGPADANSLLEQHSLLAPYGPDGQNSYSAPGIDILYRAFHTLRESPWETQPYVTATGCILTWDGRLDNRADLLREVPGRFPADCPDVVIVAAAYDLWERECFAKLVGDWALSIWNSIEPSLVLAKDFAGIRPLFYSVDRESVRWGSILDTLVLRNRRHSISEEYLAGWLSSFPAAHLTPYTDILAVPSSSYVLFKRSRVSVHRYWDFQDRVIRYKTDTDYEEHFRTVFSQSVCVRLRSECPILAELSGGMDSSSIVCMADKLAADGKAETPRVDTVSYYCDSEPNWNERPYFTKVEEARGRTGYHIDVSARSPFPIEEEYFAIVPGLRRRPSGIQEQLTTCLLSQGNRILLSGTGGDEVTGGVPTPIPELADLLAMADWSGLARGLKVWALEKRKPWIHLLLEALQVFFPPAVVPAPKSKRPAPWLHPDFVRRNRAALRGYPKRWKFLGPTANFQSNLATLNVLRRQLASERPRSEPPCEKRYPYLDRNLLEFLYSIPREQLVRPGERRSLMRRALAGIVPAEILGRRRKAFVVRQPTVHLLKQRAGLLDMAETLVSSSEGIVDAKAFSHALQKACNGLDVPIVALVRTLEIELWLRGMRIHKRKGEDSSSSLVRAAAGEKRAGC
jgi:asparagine synthase (glutamine-hydrolysing)